MDLTNGGLPSAHLREHMSSGEPIVVTYHPENGVNVADRYTDAATEGPTGPPTPTMSPTAGPSAKPTPTPTTAPTAVLPFHLSAQPFADGFLELTFLTNAGDGSGDLYVVEQRGKVYRMAADGTVDMTSPFLDIVDKVSCCDERGLLGLAFHPSFADNGRLFVDYTNVAGNTIVAELSLGADGNVDPESERFLLGIRQPFPNHNGGMLAFGADGYLYIGAGDGGSGGDPYGNGQSTDTLLGKILRIDVDHGDPYAIPDGNPYPVVNRAGAKPEIWDVGMRNPWRFSFDRATGDLWIGDVGQDRYEEVDAEPAGEGGRNYGWNTMEATHCFLVAGCDSTGITLPVAEYSHNDGCSITGGYVYRGSLYPALVGLYVFSDYCSGNLWAIDAASSIGAGPVTPIEYGNANINPTAFGEDESGELYLVNGAGQIFRLTAD
ncbi:MAG: PQQ-dependent sugar dehydrogenase [Chloroflexota bacterium]|nr:PQQ-dependent sugar dehydrogenase [Chloroflexota bacterium]